MKRGERDHLLRSEPDKAETRGYHARAVVDHCSIVRPCEQSCSLCEAEKPHSNKQRANDPKDDLHDSTLAARSTTVILIETKRVAIEKAAELARRLRGTSPRPALSAPLADTRCRHRAIATKSGMASARV
jgi:hypothetical protein